MRIYSMTATFGKLEHATLTLQPGLNVIHAPNEWGKSTWCAFLIDMLYGIETRYPSTKTALVDKDRYAPWSGAPMSGSMDIQWNGRDITIQRRSKGRLVFGEFHAFETASGVEVPELTAANCGQMLLGVEKSVFTRAGFLKLTDLPVTGDTSLWRRLNALVTTGDESGASDTLAEKLKDLKNQCRSNRANGLIPKAEAQKDELERKLSELEQLRQRSQKLYERKEDVTVFHAKLQNHRAALQYEAAREQTRRAQMAQLRLEQAKEQVKELEQVCQTLPEPDVLYHRLSQLQELRRRREALQMEAQMLPQAPASPEPAAPFRGYTPAQALEQAEADAAAYDQLKSTQYKPSTLLFILGLCLIGTGITTYLLNLQLPGILLGAAGLILTVIGLLRYHSTRQKLAARELRLQTLTDRYRPLAPGSWVEEAQSYGQKQVAYEAGLERHRQEQSRLQSSMEEVAARLAELTGGLSGVECEEGWRNAIAKHNAYSDALRQQRQAEDVMQALSGQTQLPPPPSGEDTLTYTEAETARLLSDAEQELRQLQHEIGRCNGQMDTLGQQELFRTQLDEVNARLARLYQTYEALDLAQKMLTKASGELQRRFAPRISSRAQAIFSALTGNRYNRLTLGSDFTLNAGARDEDTLRSTLWRSDGTVDQLYLALRLAVAEELTPDAPLVLDDALVRFDDDRLAAAMEVLKEASQSKQVLLFTCQKRESNYL